MCEGEDVHFQIIMVYWIYLNKEVIKNMHLQICSGLCLSFVILRNFTVAKISIQKDTYALAGQR